MKTENMKSINLKKMTGLLLTILLLTACGKEEIDELPDAYQSENFVQVYIKPGTLKTYHYNENMIVVSFKGEEINNRTPAEFAKLSNYYKDISYNKKLAPNSNISVAEEFTTIHVISDKSIDDIPAGSSWNNIITLCGMSPYKFIQSGYKTYDTNYPSFFDRLPLNNTHGQSPVFKALDDITKDDLILLSETFVLRVEKELPEGEYPLTITVSNNQTKLSNTVKYIITK